MTCAQVLPTRFALGSHTKTADKVCNRWSRGGWRPRIVTRIDELFAIDAEARRQALSLEARHALPQQQLRPLALAKACNYVLTLWDKLTRFLEYPELELS